MGKNGSAHNLCFFPHLSDMKNFSNELSHHLKNITLSLNLLNKTNILILEFFCIVQEVEAASAKMNKLQVIQKIKEDQKTKEEKKCLKKEKNF